MRKPILNGLADHLHVMRGLTLGAQVRTLAGNVTLVADSPTAQVMDPGGSARTVTLPAEADSEGLVFLIINSADAAEVITVEDDGTTTQATIAQDEAALLFCDGTSWHSLVGPNT